MYVRVSESGITSGTNRSVWRRTKRPVCKSTSNSFIGESSRTVGGINEIAVLNCTGSDPDKEVTTKGYAPSHSGGEFVKGKSSTFTGREGHHQRTAARTIKTTNRPHFHACRPQYRFLFVSPVTIASILQNSAPTPAHSQLATRN